MLAMSMKTTTTMTRRLSIEIEQDQAEAIIKEWVMRSVKAAKDFPDLKVEIDSGPYEGCRFSCSVTGTCVQSAEEVDPEGIHDHEALRTGSY